MIKQLFFFALALYSVVLSGQEVQKHQVVIYFDVDTDTPSAKAIRALLPDLKTARVTRIYGHADSTATSGYNQALSMRRAKNVAAALKKNGISLTGTEIKAFGETEPVGSGLITDRRVVLYYETGTGAAPVAATGTLREQVKNAQKGDKLKIKNLNFENNSDIVLPSSRPVLNELLAIMKENPKLKIDIQGHICCENADVNMISQKRALAVYAFLKNYGIDRSRLSYQSFGSSRPIYPLPEQSEEQKTANRRVEIEILAN